MFFFIPWGIAFAPVRYQLFSESFCKKIIPRVLFFLLVGTVPYLYFGMNESGEGQGTVASVGAVGTGTTYAYRIE